MATHKIKRGIDLPITGAPRQEVVPAPAVAKVALVGPDSVGMRPRFAVEVGARVRRGEVLFTDRKRPEIRYTSPAAGTVVAIHRGARRAFQSVVVELSDAERAGAPAADEVVTFQGLEDKSPLTLGRDAVRSLLTESGLWTAIRQRPFGKVADPGIVPRSIFVTAIDTNPLAASADVVLDQGEAKGHFGVGLIALSRLTDGVTWLCKRAGSTVEAPGAATEANIRTEEFAGPHPAGNVGTHIHLLDPVCRGKTVWYVGYQDVVSIGRLISSGRLDVERIVSIAGPQAKDPRLVRTRVGASLDDLTRGELADGETRVVSGSVLSGRTSVGPAFCYLGRYHQQVSLLRDARERRLLAWMRPGLDRYSIIPAYASALLGSRSHAFTTSTQGSERAIVPIGLYERVMPLDIQPSFLIKSLLVGDLERAEQLGALELEEEDLALCTFVCPGKVDFGPVLRGNLATIEKEG